MKAVENGIVEQSVLYGSTSAEVLGCYTISTLCGKYLVEVKDFVHGVMHLFGMYGRYDDAARRVGRYYENVLMYGRIGGC